MRLKVFLVLVCLITTTLAVIPAVALSGNETLISFSDLGLMTHSDVEIYGLNSTPGTWELLGVYNTSSPGLTFQPGTYQAVLRPSAVSRVTNPTTMLTDGLSFLETYWIQIFVVVGLIAILVRKR